MYSSEGAAWKDMRSGIVRVSPDYGKVNEGSAPVYWASRNQVRHPSGVYIMGSYVDTFNFIRCQDDILECSSCKQKAPLRQFDRPPLKNVGSPHHWLCEICAGTLAGNAYQYPSCYDNFELYATVAGVGNIIRTDLGVFKRVPYRDVVEDVAWGKKEDLLHNE